MLPAFYLGGFDREPRRSRGFLDCVHDVAYRELQDAVGDLHELERPHVGRVEVGEGGDEVGERVHEEELREGATGIC